MVVGTRRHWLTLGLAFAVSLRLVYVLSIPNSIARWRDGLSYDTIARNVVSGVGYRDNTGEWPGEPPYADPSAPTLRWLPGYPLFVAGVYRLFGHSYRAVYLAQAVLALAIAGLVYLVGVHTVGASAGVLAVFLYTVDPFSIFLTGRFQTEQLFTLLVLASVYSFLRLRQGTRGQLWFALSFGLLAGAAALTRTIAGMMFAGLCLAALAGLGEGFARMRPRRRVFLLAIASAAFLGMLAPWVIRNHGLTGQYILTTEAWTTLAMTNNDSGGAYFTPRGFAAMPRTSIEQSEIEREAIYRAFVTDWIASNPWRFAGFYLWRTVAFWSPWARSATGAQAALGFVFNAVVLALAAVYIITQRTRWRELSPVYIVFVTFTLGYSLAAAITRFRLPLHPFLEILAAGGVLFVLGRARSRDARLPNVTPG
jgi:4-amino-4-deoxy-L-arabinose transferase-like glycosyltransferase